MGRRSAENYLALIEVVRLLRAGPRSIVPVQPGADEEQWLESYIKMSQATRTTDGTFDAVSLYEVPLMISPAQMMPMVRFLSWNRQGDRARCKKGVVKYPEVKIEYYSLQRTDLSEVDEWARELQSAVSAFPVNQAGLNLHRSYGIPGIRARALPRLPDSIIPALQRWLHVGTGAGSIQGDFFEGSSPSLDDAWSRMWSGLTSKRENQRRHDDVEEVYTLAPGRYAEVLTRELADHDQAD